MLRIGCLRQMIKWGALPQRFKTKAFRYVRMRIYYLYKGSVSQKKPIQSSEAPNGFLYLSHLWPMVITINKLAGNQVSTSTWSAKLIYPHHQGRLSATDSLRIWIIELIFNSLFLLPLLYCFLEEQRSLLVAMNGYRTSTSGNALALKVFHPAEFLDKRIRLARSTKVGYRQSNRCFRNMSSTADIVS